MPEQQGVMSTYQLTAHDHSGVGQGGLVDPTVINHDALLNFLANEHLTLPNTIANVLTDHNKVAHDALLIDADLVDGIHIPNTIANVLTNHTKAVHDALGIELLGNKVFINDTLNANLTIGLTINQGANDDEILALKSSDVAHGMTDETETDTYGLIQKWIPASGGLRIIGLGEITLGTNIIGYYTTDNTTKSAAGGAPIEFSTAKKSGTGIGNVGADANVVCMKTWKGGAWSTVWIVDEDGDVWQYGNLTLESAASIITGGTLLNIEAGATGIESHTIRDDICGDVANVHIGTVSGKLWRTTSSIKYKDKVEDLELDSSLIYNLLPRSFNAKSGDTDKEKRYVGLIAEEVAKIYPDIIAYGKNKSIEHYDSQMLLTLMLAELQKLNGRVSALEN